MDSVSAPADLCDRVRSISQHYLGLLRRAKELRWRARRMSLHRREHSPEISARRRRSHDLERSLLAQADELEERAARFAQRYSWLP